MDPIINPYSPGAGSPPPELAGRDDVLGNARILLGRALAKRSEKSMLLVGLRGVGKTVLLNEISHTAEDIGYRIASIEATEDRPLVATLAPHLRDLHHELNRLAGVGEKVKRYLTVLRSFLGTIKVSASDYALEIEPTANGGGADSGDLEFDITTVLLALAEAAQERKTGIALLIDEMQYIDLVELGALIGAMHKVQQGRLPLVVVGAGLPVLTARCGEAKSYSERLFSYPVIGPLSEADALHAIVDPARALGVVFDNDAASNIFRTTHGYPYFLQEWAYQCWNVAESSPITQSVVDAATPTVIARLDQNFFRVRYDRLAPGEKSFLRAMAELGPGPSRTSQIAEVMGVLSNSLSPVRARVIKKGMVYSPSHGELAFTVPLFDEFMIRSMPGFAV